MAVDRPFDRWVQQFGLAPHPEGGAYREVFRADTQVATPRGPREASTAIYYSLPAGGVSAWHRVAADEVWHRYAGGPLTLHLLDDDGYRALRLDAEQPLAVVPAGCWQAAEAAEDALCGCTVAPGFRFEDFEMADGDALAAAYPSASEVAQRLAAR
jgi:predicted cupin superfamily sugar epimerase